MKFAGVQPYAYLGNQLYLLLGQETKDGLWSNFAGAVEEEQYYEDAAAREGYEELMGLLGSKEDIFDFIQDSIEVVYENGVIYAFEIPFNLDLSWYFQNFYDYILKANIDQPYGFFEKQSIKWVSVEEIESSPGFYRECFLNGFKELIYQIDKENLS